MQNVIENKILPNLIKYYRDTSNVTDFTRLKLVCKRWKRLVEKSTYLPLTTIFTEKNWTVAQRSVLKNIQHVWGLRSMVFVIRTQRRFGKTTVLQHVARHYKCLDGNVFY